MGVGFSVARVNAPGKGGTVDGLSDGRAPSLALLFALFSEARCRKCDVRTLAPENPDIWTALGPGGPTPDLMNQARAAINAPKVWAAVNAVAGRLQARHELDHAGVLSVVEWVAGAQPPKVG